MSIFRTTNPLEFDDVDGIIVNESAPSPDIQGVAANTAILVGQFERGPDEELTSVGSIGQFHEIFGKNDLFLGNLELKNKKFGALKIIRAIDASAAKSEKTFQDGVAADAITFRAKYKGAYGDNIQVKIENSGSDVIGVKEKSLIECVADVAGSLTGKYFVVPDSAGTVGVWFSHGSPEQSLVECVADVSDSLDGTYFVLPDAAGTVGFWIDTDDSGTAEPSHGATRGVEITTIATDDNAATVATKVAAAIQADAAFLSATVQDTDNVLVIDVADGSRAGQSAGTSGFTVSEDTAGVTNGTEPVHGATRALEISTITVGDSAANVATKVAAALQADSAFSIGQVQDTDDVLLTDETTGARAGQAAGDSGFTVSEDTAGVTAVEGGVKYTIKDTNTDAVLPEEVYDDVIVTGKTQTQLSEIFKDSNLIDPIVASPVATAEPVTAAFTALAGGSDGTIADTDYEAAIAVAEPEKSGNVMWCDYYTANIRGYLKLHCTNSPDKMVILAGNDTSQSAASAISDVASYRDTEGRVIYAWNPLQTSINGVNTYTSPASWLASIISNTSPHIDPAYANNAQYTVGASTTKYKPTRTEFIALKEAGICAFEVDPDIGIKPKSGIVTQISNSSKVTILRRRMADYLTQSVAFFLKNYQNAPNTLSNRSEVKGSILAWDQNQVNNGILPSDDEVNDGLASLIDTESLNTDSSIGLGYFKILYKRRIYSSMRYIVLQAQIGETVVVTEGS